MSRCTKKREEPAGILPFAFIEAYKKFFGKFSVLIDFVAEYSI